MVRPINPNAIPFNYSSPNPPLPSYMQQCATELLNLTPKSTQADFTTFQHNFFSMLSTFYSKQGNTITSIDITNTTDSPPVARITVKGSGDVSDLNSLLNMRENNQLPPLIVAAKNVNNSRNAAHIMPAEDRDSGTPGQMTIETLCLLQFAKPDPEQKLSLIFCTDPPNPQHNYDMVIDCSPGSLPLWLQNQWGFWQH